MARHDSDRGIRRYLAITVKLTSVQAVFQALDKAGVRFLVVGGLAVNAHGYRRFTDDVDLVIQLNPDNVAAAFDALAHVGYGPRVPITAAQFGDRDLRETLMREKGMQVLQFWSDSHRETSIDVFVSEPFDFETEYRRAVVKELAGVGPIHFVTIPTLIAMKELAGRPEDRIDIEYLRQLLDEGPDS